MPRKYNNIVEKSLKCSVCENILTIWRKKSKDKEPGHLKHMWCPVCKGITAHQEMKRHGGYGSEK